MDSSQVARMRLRGYAHGRLRAASLQEPEGDPPVTEQVLETPSESPSSTQHAKHANQDRGRTLAVGILVGFIGLGGALIVRSWSQRRTGDVAASYPLPILTYAELPRPLTPQGSPHAPESAPLLPPTPKFVPVWRVAALESDPAIDMLRGTLGKSSFAGALAHAGLSKVEVRRIEHTVNRVRRIEHATPSDAFVVARSRPSGTVLAFEYIASPTDVWQAKSEESEGGLAVKKLALFVEKKNTSAALVVTSDLSKACAAAGVHAEAMADIVDALEGHGEAAIIKPGVRLRVVGHEDWVEGALGRYVVSALEYVPRVGNSLRVYFYERDGSASASSRHTPHPGFYDAKFQQPFRGMFRSPLPLARVTSHFNPKRMHPVLHIVMPHNGVDFGAATGTPVFASGAGTLSHAGDSGPCGNMIQIEHENGLSTAYCHLSRFASGVQTGQHVEARQLVGYVGQTGRATGPHLHFAVKRKGIFIDPMVLKLDGVRTLPPSDRESFAKKRADLDIALDAVALPSLNGINADDKDDVKDEPDGEE